MQNTEISGISTSTRTNYITTLIRLEKSMANVLTIWEADNDYTEELSQQPWLDKNSLKLMELDRPIKAVISLSESLRVLEPSFLVTNMPAYMSKVRLYFDGPAFAILIKTLDSGSTLEDKLLLQQYSYFKKAYRNLVAGSVTMLSVDEIIETDFKNIDYAYAQAEGDLGIDLKSYFTYLSRRAKDMPMSTSDIVNQSMELFVEKIRNSNLELEEFLTCSESVMPWDIRLITQDKLLIDELYLARLQQRVDDPFSIYNNMPSVLDISDLIPDHELERFYLYEFEVRDFNIDEIKQKRTTITQLLDFIEKTPQNSSFFGGVLHGR